MKVFWKREAWAAPKTGEVEKADTEEVEFPGALFGELREALEGSQGVLPVGARRFQGWEVGLLERFDGVDLDGDGDVNSGEEDG